jgi:hypothetical protein
MERTLNESFSRKQLVKMLAQLYTISTKAEALIDNEILSIQTKLKTLKKQEKTK